MTNLTLEEKQKILKQLQDKMKKEYGEKNAPRLANEIKEIEFYKTGVVGIDLALGGGMAKGRIIGVSGAESSCKTTLALTTIANAQKKDPTFMAYYYDAEKSLDREYAENLGVDLSRLIVDDTDVAEEGLTKLRDSIDSGIYGIAVLDSTNAICPSKFDDTEISATEMGIRARVLSNAYPQLVGKCAKTGTLLIVIEQIRMKIGGYGNPEVNTVGNAGKFYMSQRISMRRKTEVTEENGIAISNEVACKVIKNKVAPPFRKCDLVCIYGKGFDEVTDTVNLATQFGVLTDKSHYYKRGTEDEVKWKSKDACIQYMRDNIDFFEKIKEETMSVYENSDSKLVMQDEDSTDKDNAEKERMEEIQRTSNEVE